MVKSNFILNFDFWNYIGVPSTRHQWKSKSLPPGKMKERREAAKSGDSIKIKIKEIKKLDDEEVSSTSVTNSETSQTIVKTSPTSSNNKLNKTKFTKSSTVESLDMEEDVSVRSEGWCSTILDYILERTEYAFPENHGWRIKFRRIFLHLGQLNKFSPNNILYIKLLFYLFSWVSEAKNRLKRSQMYSTDLNQCCGMRICNMHLKDWYPDSVLEKFEDPDTLYLHRTPYT